MRITRKVFYDLAIWMVALGLAVGLLFPFFVTFLGVDPATAFSLQFMVSCLGAGAAVGLMNHALAHGVVGSRIQLLATRMWDVHQQLKAMTYSLDLSLCGADRCMIPVDSEDELGEAARAFNRLVDALAQSIATQAAVRSFSEAMTSFLDIKELAEQALSQFFQHTGAVGGVILCESDGELKVAACRGIRDPDKVAESDHVQRCAATRTTEVIAIPEHIRVDGLLMEVRPSEVLLVPIQHKQVLLGVVVLATVNQFDSDHLGRVELFRQGLGLALNNAIAHDRLQRLAALDPLTGVYNRRFGLGRLHEEFGRAVRARSPLGVLMMDIDHFKRVNDTYGHLVGDRLLKAVAAIMRASMREGDILVRYGGEEFLAVLPAASLEDVRLVAERIRRSVEESVLADGERSVRVTLSAGGAAYPTVDVDTERELVSHADEALYRAKSLGRNRVELAR